MSQQDNNQHSSAWRITGVLLIVLGLLVGAQFLPLSEWTDGRLSNINLFSSISDYVFHDDIEKDTAPVDPMLAELEAEDAAEQAAKSGSRPTGSSDGKGSNGTPAGNESARSDGDGTESTETTSVVAIQPSRNGDAMVIEDYTLAGKGLEHLRKAIKKRGSARIAVLGDSYIEGDIMTQDLRVMAQDAFGGNGVGYLPVDPAFGNFRQTVKPGKASGWKNIAVNGKYDSKYMPLTQQYNKSTGRAKASFSGTQKLSHLNSWNQSKFLFISPVNTTITLTTDDGPQTFDVRGSEAVQCLTVNGQTSKFDVDVASAGVISLGVWLSDSTGVAVDNMSMRGVSGMTLSSLNPGLASQMSNFVDYDLIILEFGINAMSASQTNYDAYSRRMQKVVENIRTCYPQADIVLMGIGDRGQKRSGEYHSMKVCQTMVNAQREAARNAHCHFYDTRESMGGEDAIVNWVRDGYANKDYIHMNLKGGRQLATPLFNAIKSNVNKQ